MGGRRRSREDDRRAWCRTSSGSDYKVTRPAAAIYRRAFPELAAGAKQLRDAITSGDANGVVAGSQAIAQGLADYAPVRPMIGALVEQAIVQQRLLTQ